jgi:hypothetical protein
MLVMDGWDFLRAQLADDRLAAIPVVVMTGCPDAAAMAVEPSVAAVLPSRAAWKCCSRRLANSPALAEGRPRRRELLRDRTSRLQDYGWAS